jgi:signal transduction histidine kinase
MARFIDWKNFLSVGTIGLTLIGALAIATSLSLIFGLDLALGKAWIIVFVAVILSFVLFAKQQKNLDLQEIKFIVFLVLLFFVLGWAMNKFLPELFSSVPDSLRGLYSTIGVK